MVDDSNELAKAFYQLFNVVLSFSVLEFLSVWFPILKRIVRPSPLMPSPS